MKHFFLWFFAVLLCTVSLTAKASIEYVYLSSGNSITVFLLSEQSGNMIDIQSVPLARAGVFAISSDNKYLYVATQQGKKSQIATYTIGRDGLIKHLHSAPAGNYPTYLSQDNSNRFLYGSHYGAGKLSVWSTRNRIFKGESARDTRVYDLEKNAHSAVFSPAGNHLFVPATGPNKIFQFVVDKMTGALKPNSKPFTKGPRPGGAKQPRHIKFHPTRGIAYTSLEREQPGVGVWDWDRKKGQLEFRNALVSHPSRFKGKIHTAELQLSPGARFLYLSNRDVTPNAERFYDSIGIYRISRITGNLSHVADFATGRIPRAFCISQSGRYVLIANQKDNTLQVARRDQDSGLLENISTRKTGNRPVWVQTIVK